MTQDNHNFDKNSFSNYDLLFDSNQQTVILDPTELYEIPSNYISITTELEWIRSFRVSDGQYWIKGARLCQWTREWLRVWNKTDIIQEIKQNPRSIIKTIIEPFAIPETWTDRDCLEIATKLSSYPQDNPIPYFLAEITNTNLQKIWLATPSKEHLAEWLTIQVPEKWKIWETVWQTQLKVSPLSLYYKTENKLQLLRQWLELNQPAISELGKYPLTIPDDLTQDFDESWQEKIIRSEATVLDEIDLIDQVESERISKISYEILKQRPQWITHLRVKQLTPYLNSQQRQNLENYQPPAQPKLLSLDAKPEQALQWVTEEYLPFRRWEIVIKQPSVNERITDHLAESFVNWIVKHYPQLKLTPADHSLLNYNVAHLVQMLCQESPILWVVVDGLGWLDHLELLSYLTEDQSLAIEQSITPRFSILPTITKYAKWSLYTQLFPNSSQWKDDIKQGFNLMRVGQHYTDKQVHTLYQDLQAKSQLLYCWDTTLFDDLQHHQKDWQSFYELDRLHTLRRIAERIHYCLNKYPSPDQLRIIIATDHGQVLGQSSHLSNCPPQLEPSGRMAKGTTDDPRFIVLDADRFELPYDISIIKGSESCNAFSYTQEKQIIGSHGGLLPEEVVIGFSVLRQSVKRLPVLITCCGEGEANKSGFITVTIDNPNSVTLTNLSLTIEQLPTLNQNELSTKTIPPNQKCSFTLSLSSYPELRKNNKNDQLLLSGKLTFQYAHTEPGLTQLDNHSVLTIKQLFSSGLDIDEFL